FADEFDLHFGPEAGLELRAIFGDRAQPFNYLVVRVISHLQRIDERLKGLIFKRVRAPVPELPRVEHRVEQRRRIARAATARDSFGDGATVGEGELRVVAGGARNSAVNRQPRVEKEPAAQLDLRARHRILSGNVVIRGVRWQPEGYRRIRRLCLRERSGKAEEV